MFPDKLIMLREHFRCVEPIIRFSMGFYPEPLVPLRIPTAHERLDPPLVDIYVPDGDLQPGLYRLKLWTACTPTHDLKLDAEVLIKSSADMNLRPVTAVDLLHQGG